MDGSSTSIGSPVSLLSSIFTAERGHKQKKLIKFKIGTYLILS